MPSSHNALFAAAPVPLFAFDSSLRVIDVNDAFVAMFGVPRELLLNFDLRCLRDRALLECFERACAGEPTSFEGSHASEFAGRVLEGYLKVAPVRGPDGAFAGGVATVVEHTSRVPAAEPDKERLALVWQASTDGIWEVDVESRALSLSPRLRANLGYTNDTLPDDVDRLRALIHPDDLPAVRRSFREHLTSRAPFDVELRLRDVSGDYRYLRARAQAAWDENGRPRRVLGTLADVTALRRARAAAREAEELFRGLADQSLTGIYMIDGDRFVYANPRCAEMFGYDLSELPTLGPLDLVAPEDRAHVAASLAERLSRDIRNHYVARARRKDGSQFWIEIYGSSIPREGRRIVIGTLLDVTARVESENRMRELLAEAETERRRLDFERTRLARVVERAPTFFALTRGPEHVFELANDAYLEVVGHRELIGKRVIDALPEIRGQGLVELLDGVYKTGEQFCARAVPVMLERGGKLETRFFTFTYMAMSDESGQTTGLLCNGCDVTEQVLAERALRESDNRMRAQFKALPVPTYAWQLSEHDGVRDFYLIDFSDSARDSFSKGAAALEALRGIPASKFIREPEVIEGMWRALEERRPIRRAAEYTDAAGNRRRFSITYSAAPPDVVLAHVEAVTDREALEEQLRQAQKMEAVGQLAGGFAHDLNNILCVIRTCGEFIAEATAEQVSVHDDAQNILNAADRASELTQHLLTFSRRQVTRMRAVDVHAVLGDLGGMIRRLIGRQMHVVVRTDALVPLVRADRSQLEQVVLNLALNARDAMNGTGTLSIETSNEEIDARAGTIRGLPAGRYLALSVVDSGCGMTPEVKRRVFEPFFTTKEPGHGTGLGLSTVYGIVRQLGGSIDVETEVGRGSCFRVVLPTYEGTPSEAPRAEPRVALPTAKARVLLVEDEAGVRALARRILERAGYEVLATSSGPEALALANDQPRRPDLLLTDMVMPDMSGRQVHMKLLERWPALRAVYMSGYTEDEVVRAGATDGSLMFLPKPFGAAELVAAVEQALALRHGASDPEG